jgi:hypothetical protein
MAPRRKQNPLRPGREYKIRIPEDVAKRIEAKARGEGRPQNRVIINELAQTPHLEQFRDLASLVGELKVVLARYGARISWHDLSDELLGAVDALLAAEGGALHGAVDRLAAVRGAMRIQSHQEKGEPQPRPPEVDTRPVRSGRKDR